MRSALIDEVQHAPDLFLASRLDVLAARVGQLINHRSYDAPLGLTAPTAQKY